MRFASELARGRGVGLVRGPAWKDVAVSQGLCSLGLWALCLLWATAARHAAPQVCSPIWSRASGGAGGAGGRRVPLEQGHIGHSCRQTHVPVGGDTMKVKKTKTHTHPKTLNWSQELDKLKLLIVVGASSCVLKGCGFVS